MNGWDEAMKSGGPIVISIVAAVALVTGRGVAAPAHTTNIADVARCNEDAKLRADNPSAAPGRSDRSPTLTPERGTRTDASGTIVAESTDPLLEGMAAAGLKDPAYRTAYRECMAARTVRQP
jgi:hypothetical protein